jgi:hypothetical protein
VAHRRKIGGRRRGQKADALKASINQQLAALPLEAKLGMNKPEANVNKVNISNSTVANLNLGSVMATLTVPCNNLNMEGRGEVAEAIKQLAEQSQARIA